MTMMLTSDQTIVGIRALSLRDALKKSIYETMLSGELRWVVDSGTLALSLFGGGDADVAEVLAELVRLGYVDDGQALTKLGKSFLNASGAPRVKRSTADRLIRDLIQRVQHVNTSDDFIDRVAALYVFGSYVAGAERLGDVDIYAITEPKDPNRDINAGERHAAKSRRSFRSILDLVCWPVTQIRLYLKNRKRSLSLILDNHRRSQCPPKARLVELWPVDRRNEEIPGGKD